MARGTRDESVVCDWQLREAKNLRFGVFFLEGVWVDCHEGLVMATITRSWTAFWNRSTSESAVGLEVLLVDTIVAAEREQDSGDLGIRDCEKKNE